MMSDREIPPVCDAEVEAVSADAPRPKWEIWCVAVLLVYFLARLLFLAVNINPELPPDESTHLGIIGLYAESPLFIDDSPESHKFGLVTRQPHLYYFALGKLAVLNIFGMNDVLYLRLLNVILAMLTVIAGYRLAAHLTRNSLIRILFLVMTTNTLMFTFIGGAVSYDNLVNLLAVLSVMAFIAFVRTENSADLLLFLLWSFLGTLTKTTFLPLTFGLVALLLFDRRRHLREDLSSLAGVVKMPARLPAVLLVLVILSFGANVWLYGSNLVRYGRPVPGCSQVLELEQCMENRIFARNWIVGQYRDGKLTFEQAFQQTSRINHPGDRDHAVRLLQNERAYRQSKPKLLPRWDYIQIVWEQAMKPTIFGVQAHLSMVKDPSALLPYNLVLFAAFVLWIRGVGWSRSERPWTYLAAISMFYFLFLIGYVNYGFYTSSHAPFVGVQGRYLFPILVPACPS
jgi:4-amino-4-deoxy-L-arabinose transferase-like glycosyltransferase